ncbi:MAG: YHYH domain-containing protein [Sphingomonadales bacterium]
MVGGLNSEGCHHNRKTGGYHCHRAPSRPATPLSNQGPIKLAPSGTCYGPSSESYGDIIAVKRFQSIAACRQAGGR